jgi:hypothetical protein
MKTTLMKTSSLTATVLFMMLGGACANESDETGKPTPTLPNVDSDYGITAYVSKADGLQTLTFRRETNNAVEIGTTSAPLKPSDITFDPDAGNGTQSVPSTSTNTMKDLARMAMSECGLRGTGTTGNTTSYYQNQKTGSCVGKQVTTGKPFERVAAIFGNSLPVASVWTAAEEPSCTGLDVSAQPFVFFYYEPKTAAQVLQYEETLIWSSLSSVDSVLRCLLSG